MLVLSRKIDEVIGTSPNEITVRVRGELLEKEKQA